MANPAVTYTFVNGNVADASQVNQNFTDLINSLTDGTKSLNIDALTVGGAFAANGSVDLGNAASDTISMVGYVDTNMTIKSTDAGASAGPDLIIDRDSASAADSDAIGRIIFRGNDDAGTPADNDYASIEATIVDSGAGSEDGKLDMKISVAGTPTSYITAESTKGVKLQGATDGTALTDSSYDGKVGELIGSSISAVTATWTSGTSAASMAGLSLPAGNYLILGNATGYIDSVPGGTSAAIGCDLYNSTDAALINYVDFIGVVSNAGVTTDSANTGLNIVGVTSLSGTKTIQFRIRIASAGGSPTNATATSRVSLGYLWAIRLP